MIPTLAGLAQWTESAFGPKGPGFYSGQEHVPQLQAEALSFPLSLKTNGKKILG